MNSLTMASSSTVARAVQAFVMTLLLAACAGPGGRTPPASVEPSTTNFMSTSPTSIATSAPIQTPSAFPTALFAAINQDPVSDARAATFQTILAGMAGGGGIASTVMTPEGTWSGAAGTSDGVHALSVDSQFGIASVTKSLVAAQVMQLVEAGELSLDEPAMRYLPADFAFDTNGATIRQLLDMRSGIPDWFDDQMKATVEADRDRDWTLSEVLALIGEARHPVGSSFEYADTNYNVLGVVIEHVRKRPLIDVLRDGILRVEGTERLIYQPDEAPTEPMAMPLGESRDALKKGAGFLPSLSDASSAGPAGAMASDSLSLARWWRAFCAGELVSEASLTEMTKFVGGSDGYGLGLFNPADPWGFGVGHTGGNFGYSSWAGCMPDDKAVVVILSNFSIDDLGGSARPLVRAIGSN